MGNKIYTLVLLCAALISNAQFNVTINGKKVAAGQEFNYSDLKSLIVSFTNPQKLPTYSDGILLLDCKIFDKNNNLLASVHKKVEGAASINAFLNPKSPKEYTLMPKKEIGDLSNYNLQFSDRCEELKANPNADKVTVKFSLILNELLKTDYNGSRTFGDDVELLDPFQFTLNIADKNAWINCTPINAKFKLSDLTNMGYEKFDTTRTWSLARGCIDANGKALKETDFIFKDYYFEIANIQYTNGASQDDNLKTFKDEADKCAKMASNLCYQKAKDTDIFYFGYLTFLGLSEGPGSGYLDKFDKKSNKNYEKETLWEPFTAGSISGFKSINTIIHSGCTSTKKEIGGHTTYVFKNPYNTKALLVIRINVNTNYEFKITPEQHKEMQQMAEKFISVLNFSKQ